MTAIKFIILCALGAVNGLIAFIAHKYMLGNNADLVMRISEMAGYCWGIIVGMAICEL